MRFVRLVSIVALFALIQPASGKQAPGSVVLNQLRFPVVFQLLTRQQPTWTTFTLKPGQSGNFKPGCLRYSTGSPRSNVYYVLLPERRYGFYAAGRLIGMHFTEANDKEVLRKAAFSDSQCNEQAVRQQKEGDDNPD